MPLILSFPKPQSPSPELNVKVSLPVYFPSSRTQDPFNPYHPRGLEPRRPRLPHLPAHLSTAVTEEQSEGRREGAAGWGKAGRERQEGGHGVGKKARADRPGVRREETGMGRCRDCEGVQYGEVGPGDSEELGTRELGPHSPRSSMAGHRQTTLGEQGGDRVRWGGVGVGGERPGAGGPAVTM